MGKRKTEARQCSKAEFNFSIDPDHREDLEIFKNARRNLERPMAPRCSVKDSQASRNKGKAEDWQ